MTLHKFAELAALLSANNHFERKCRTQIFQEKGVISSG